MSAVTGLSSLLPWFWWRRCPRRMVSSPVGEGEAAAARPCPVLSCPRLYYGTWPDSRTRFNPRPAARPCTRSTLLHVPKPAQTHLPDTGLHPAPTHFPLPCSHTLLYLALTLPYPDLTHAPYPEPTHLPYRGPTHLPYLDVTRVPTLACQGPALCSDTRPLS